MSTRFRELVVGLSLFAVIPAAIAHGATLLGASRAVTVGPAPLGIAVSDFNDDGSPDLAACGADHGTGWVTVLLADGGGGYVVEMTISTGTDAPKDIVSSDFTGDGRSDFAIAVRNLYSGASAMWVYAGDGTGHFSRVATIDIGWGPQSMIAVDFNSDGRPDLAVSCSAIDSVYVALNQVNGTEWSVRTCAANLGPYGIASADVDRDGHPDLLAVGPVTHYLSVFHNNGDGSFAPRVDYPTGNADGWYLACADLNGDGWMDAVMSDDDAAVHFMLGGSSGFNSLRSYSTNPNARGLAVGDFTGDGQPDIVVSEGGYYDDVWSCLTSSTASIFTWVAGDSFAFVQQIACGSEPWRAVAADLNEDGAVDLATADARSNSVSVWYSDPRTHRFQPQEVNVPDGPIALVAADLNLDGFADVVTVNERLASSVSIMLSRPDGRLLPRVDMAVRDHPSAASLADLNGDGVPDLLVTSNTTDVLSVYAGRGNGTFALGRDFPAGEGPVALAVGDLDEDGALDVVVSDAGQYSPACDCYRGGNMVSVLLGDGRGGFASRRDLQTTKGPGAVSLADVTGDGHLDLLVLTPGSFQYQCVCYRGANQLATYTGDGRGYFSTWKLTNLDKRPVALVTGDFDADGTLDVAVADAGQWDSEANSYPGSEIQILHGSGDGTFQSTYTVETPQSPSALALADLTGDGRIDLVLASYVASTVSVYPQQPDGRYSPREDYGVGSSPLALVTPDLRADGHPDVVVANSWSYSISVLRNAVARQGKGLPATSILSKSSPTFDFDLRRKGDSIQFLLTGRAVGPARLVVLDLNGRMVWSRDAAREGGEACLIEWTGVDDSGKRLPSGIYFCRATVADQAIVRRLVLVY